MRCSIAVLLRVLIIFFVCYFLTFQIYNGVYPPNVNKLNITTAGQHTICIRSVNV